jgi:hypothetical protein
MQAKQMQAADRANEAAGCFDRRAAIIAAGAESTSIDRGRSGDR